MDGYLHFFYIILGHEFYELFEDIYILMFPDGVIVDLFGFTVYNNFTIWI